MIKINLLFRSEILSDEEAQEVTRLLKENKLLGLDESVPSYETVNESLNTKVESKNEACEQTDRTHNDFINLEEDSTSLFASTINTSMSESEILGNFPK